MTIEAMKLALEALDSDNPDIQLRAATTLRAAIEQAEQRQWVYLTNEEVSQVAKTDLEGAFVRLIEAKVREKNT